MRFEIRTEYFIFARVLRMTVQIPVYEIMRHT